MFWSPSIWLPPNITWQHFHSDQGYAQFSHLLYPFPLALVIIVVRALVERIVFLPLGKHLNIEDKKYGRPRTNPVLEEAYLTHNKDYRTLSTCTGMTEHQVYRWIRQRQQAGRPSPLSKFTETGWRWLFYLTMHVVSILVMWNKPWVWNTAYCWYNYPFHTVDPHVWWHYMWELAFYWALFISQFFDAKRKDFWEMFIHHLATLALLNLSWTNHMHRMGSLVLIVHDFADHWLEFAKLARYAKYQTVCDGAFVMFGTTWVYTRLALFPCWICYSTIVEAGQLVQMFPVYYIFNFLMTTLLMLHTMWFYFLAKVAIKVLMSSGAAEDARSDSEDSDNFPDESESDSDSDTKKLK